MNSKVSHSLNSNNNSGLISQKFQSLNKQFINYLTTCIQVNKSCDLSPIIEDYIKFAFEIKNPQTSNESQRTFHHAAVPQDITILKLTDQDIMTPKEQNLSSKYNSTVEQKLCKKLQPIDSADEKFSISSWGTVASSNTIQNSVCSASKDQDKLPTPPMLFEKETIPVPDKSSSAQNSLPNKFTFLTDPRKENSLESINKTEDLNQHVGTKRTCLSSDISSNLPKLPTPTAFSFKTPDIDSVKTSNIQSIFNKDAFPSFVESNAKKTKQTDTCENLFAKSTKESESESTKIFPFIPLKKDIENSDDQSQSITSKFPHFNPYSMNTDSASLNAPVFSFLSPQPSMNLENSGSSILNNTSTFNPFNLFGTSQGFAFTGEANSELADNDEEVPQPEPNLGVEPSAVCHVYSKLFVLNDGKYIELGVGIFNIKLIEKEPDSYQLVFRIESSRTGNILMNIRINKNKNTVQTPKNTFLLITSVPNPPIHEVIHDKSLDDRFANSTPVTYLIKTKTSNEMDEILKYIKPTVEN